MHLARLINEKLRRESALRHLAEAAQLLEEAQHAERDAIGALAALNAAEADAMARWSRGEAPAPELDTAKRAKLEADQRAAVAKASAARQAASMNAAEQQREKAVLHRIETEIALAIVPVIVEAVDPLLADFEKANRELAAKAGKIAEAAETIAQIAHGIGDLEVARPAFVTLEKLSERIRTTFARPAPDTANHRAAWLAHAAALKRDPIAELKD
jgi:hypothetical protein